MIKPAQTARQGGVSLIEILVTLVVFSIGLLGFATLQMRSMQEGFDTTQRSVAVWRAQELADRIRGNSGEVESYIASLGGNVCAAAAPTRCADFIGANGSRTAATACTSAELAAFDVWDVLCNGDDATEATLVDMRIQLECEDIDATDSLACSPGSGLTMDVCWTSKSASSDNQLEVVRGIASMPVCTAENAPAYLFDRYSLEFRP